MGDLTTFETIIIAIVEGLTEFLPVSSTGHMIITQNILGVESTEFVKAFTVIIQFGAILSVVCLYWKRFFRLNHTPAPAGASALKCFLHKFDFYWKLLVAFIPAAILGFLFSDKIDEMLESVAIVAVMLVIGGIFMLFCDKIFSKGSEDTVLTERKAFNIGLFQCIAMIPGVSRSMATIVGGMAQEVDSQGCCRVFILPCRADHVCGNRLQGVETLPGWRYGDSSQQYAGTYYR